MRRMIAMCANCKRLLLRKIELWSPDGLFYFCSYACLIEFVNREWGERRW